MNASLIKKTENCPRHFYKLPSPFARITLIIFANYPRHTNNNALNHPRLCIELPRNLICFPNAITGLHVNELLKFCIHTSDGIIADHMSYFGVFVYIRNRTTRYKPIRVGFLGSAIWWG